MLYRAYRDSLLATVADIVSRLLAFVFAGSLLVIAFLLINKNPTADVLQVVLVAAASFIGAIVLYQQAPKIAERARNKR
jgi:hypothetical protein